MDIFNNLLTVVIVGMLAICTHHALEYRHAPKPVESELLCKQTKNMNTYNNIVLECVEKGAIYGMD